MPILEEGGCRDERYGHGDRLESRGLLDSEGGGGLRFEGLGFRVLGLGLRV